LNFTVAFDAAVADGQEGNGAAAAVAALIVVLALGLQQHERRAVLPATTAQVVVVVVVMMAVVVVIPAVVVVVVILIAAVVVVVVGLVVVVLAEEVAVVTQGKLVARHQLALAQGAPEALDVVDLALGPHHKVGAAEAQPALVALGTKQPLTQLQSNQIKLNDPVTKWNEMFYYRPMATF
jgi:hypothetical protein